MSRSEWERLAQAEPRVVPHQRSKGPVSTPATRIIELTGLLQRTQVALSECLHENTALEKQLNRFTQFGGVSFGGVAMAQIWADMVLWELLLNVRKFRAIIELGTFQGGFSWWLWAQTQVRKGMNFYTYDSVVPENPPPCFEKKDIFAEAGELGKLMRLNEPCVVFCDNGNKPRELQTFAEELKSTESLLVVHDWGTEFFANDIPNTVEIMYDQFCEEIGSVSRVFRRKEST